MQIKTEKKRNRVTISLTPLIDVILLLLIFFMLTSHFIQDFGMNLELPESQSGASKEKLNTRIFIDANSNLFINNDKIELNKIGEYLKNLSDKSEVVLSADKSVSHGVVVQVMDAVKTVGFKKVIIAAKNKRSDG